MTICICGTAVQLAVGHVYNQTLRTYLFLHKDLGLIYRIYDMD